MNVLVCSLYNTGKIKKNYFCNHNKLEITWKPQFFLEIWLLGLKY